MDRINVLVVEDHATMLRIIRAILRSMGIRHIAEADDGKGAIEKLEAGNKYDVIISDWIMENITGYQLLKIVRETESCKDTPFIMVSAESCIDNIKAAKAAGVSAYVVKPFKADVLRTAIKTALNI